MCFSASSSFVSSAMLISIDIFCLHHLRKKDKKYLLFALIPLFFGIQQFIEGLIWLGLNNGSPGVTRGLSYAYLVFAFSFWPFYIPLAVFLVKFKEKFLTKALLVSMIVSGLVVSIWSYLPLILGTTIFQVKVINYSIAYYTNRAPMLDNILMLLYLYAIVTPFMIVSDRRMQIFGWLMLIAVLITYSFYRYAFCSVWCFFGAILSLYIAKMIYDLPHTAKKKG